MSTGASITDQVAKLKECAVAAAHLDDQFGRLALFLEGFGAPDIARQVRALDVPTLLTLPVDEGSPADEPEEGRAAAEELSDCILDCHGS